MKHFASHFVFLAIACSALAVIASGCNMVPLAPDAENVRIVSDVEAASCEELGKTRVKVLETIGFAKRNARHVQEELETLARNSGAELSGNAVVPAGPVEDGTRAYRVLRCPPPT